MENFSEFETQGNLPEKSTGSIISYAFEVYKGSFLYVLLVVGVMIASGIIINSFAGGSGYEDMVEQMQSGGAAPSYKEMMSMPGMQLQYGLSGIVNILLSPLFIGLLYIFNKQSSGENTSVSDLFIGYRQNTVNIILYSLISGILLGISVLLCVLPFFFVLPFFMLGAPFLLFENASFSEAFSKSFNVAKENYGPFLGASLLGILISFAGIVLCGIGILVTMYFYFAVMYALYVAYFGKPRALTAN